MRLQGRTLGRGGGMILRDRREMQPWPMRKSGTPTRGMLAAEQLLSTLPFSLPLLLLLFALLSTILNFSPNISSTGFTQTYRHVVSNLLPGVLFLFYFIQLLGLIAFAVVSYTLETRVNRISIILTGADSVVL